MGGVYVGHLEFTERIRGGSKISLVEKESGTGARRTCSRRSARDMLTSLDVSPDEEYTGPGSVAPYEATADCAAWYLTMTSPDC